MPLFEYVCNDCNKNFEELVSREKSDTVPCPVCKSANTQKKLSVFSGRMGGSRAADACPAASSCAAAGGGCCGSGSCGLH